MRTTPTVLARREISSNRFLTYVEEDLRIPAGGAYTYYQLESKFDAVVIVPVLADGRLVLERIYRHPYRSWFLEFPAGGIEPGEQPVDAAVRELEEETGYRSGKLDVLGSYEVMPGLLRMRLHVVLASDLIQTGHRNHEAMELIEVEELTVEDAVRQSEQQPTSSFLTIGLLFYERFSRRS